MCSQLRPPNPPREGLRCHDPRWGRFGLGLGRARRWGDATDLALHSISPHASNRGVRIHLRGRHADTFRHGKETAQGGGWFTCAVAVVLDRARAEPARVGVASLRCDVCTMQLCLRMRILRASAMPDGMAYCWLLATLSYIGAMLLSEMQCPRGRLASCVIQSHLPPCRR